MGHLLKNSSEQPCLFVLSISRSQGTSDGKSQMGLFSSVLPCLESRWLHCSKVSCVKRPNSNRLPSGEEPRLFIYLFIFAGGGQHSVCTAGGRPGILHGCHSFKNPSPHG